MAKEIITIESILDGQSPTQYFSHKDGFNSSIGVDPDYPIGSNTKTSGMLVPTRTENFKGVSITGVPKWLVNSPKSTNTYVYTGSGRFLVYDSDLDSAGETFVTTASGGDGQGLVYYDDFVYIMRNTEVARYGPLSTTPAYTASWWNGVVGLTTIQDNPYPTMRGVELPSHTGHVHGDNALYFCDYNNGSGMIHKIKTSTQLAYDAQTGDFTVGTILTGGTSGATALILADSDSGATGRLTITGITGTFQDNETITDTGSGSATSQGTVVYGDDAGSSFNVLDLPLGFRPVDIESFGTDLIILANETSDNAISQGKAAIFLWDPTNTDTFYRGPIYLPDPIGTALLNVNGIVYIWSGNAVSGVRVSKYTGGNSITEIVYQEDGLPPIAGGVDALGSRIVWGGFTTYPEASASVSSYGSKRADLPKGLNNIMRTASADTSNQYAAAVKYIEQDSNTDPKLIVGWQDDTTIGLDKISTTSTYNSVWRSKVFNINKKFNILNIRIPFGVAVAANMSLVPKIYIDDESITRTLATINNTNDSGVRKKIYKQQELAKANAIGENNFMLELNWAGTVVLPVIMPIEIEIETFEDEQ